MACNQFWCFVQRSMATASCRQNLVEIGGFGIALGWFLFTVTAISIIPSFTKPIGLKSTDGISPMTLLLTNVQQTFTVVNSVMQKSLQIQMCSEGFWACQPSLISLYQAVSAWLLLFFVFQTVVWYPNPPASEDEGKALEWNKKAWRIQLVSCFGLVGVTTWWALTSQCPSSVAQMGQLFGWGSSMLMVVRFAPQLLVTCKQRTAGAISYVTYLVIGVGGFSMTFFQIFFSQEHISTWFPVFVGNCFQTLIILTAAFYDYGCGRPCRGKSLEEKQAELAERTTCSFGEPLATD